MNLFFALFFFCCVVGLSIREIEFGESLELNFGTRFADIVVKLPPVEDHELVTGVLHLDTTTCPLDIFLTTDYSKPLIKGDSFRSDTIIREYTALESNKILELPLEPNFDHFFIIAQNRILTHLACSANFTLITYVHHEVHQLSLGEDIVIPFEQSLEPIYFELPMPSLDSDEYFGVVHLDFFKSPFYTTKCTIYFTYGVFPDVERGETMRNCEENIFPIIKRSPSKSTFFKVLISPAVEYSLNVTIHPISKMTHVLEPKEVFTPVNWKYGACLLDLRKVLDYQVNSAILKVIFDGSEKLILYGSSSKIVINKDFSIPRICQPEKVCRYEFTERYILVIFNDDLPTFEAVRSIHRPPIIKIPVDSETVYSGMVLFPLQKAMITLDFGMEFNPQDLQELNEAMYDISLYFEGEKQLSRSIFSIKVWTSSNQDMDMGIESSIKTFFRDSFIVNPKCMQQYLHVHLKVENKDLIYNTEMGISLVVRRRRPILTTDMEISAYVSSFQVDDFVIFKIPTAVINSSSVLYIQHNRDEAIPDNDIVLNFGNVLGHQNLCFRQGIKEFSSYIESSSDALKVKFDDLKQSPLTNQSSLLQYATDAYMFVRIRKPSIISFKAIFLKNNRDVINVDEDQPLRGMLNTENNFVKHFELHINETVHFEDLWVKITISSNTLTSGTLAMSLPNIDTCFAESDRKTCTLTSLKCDLKSPILTVYYDTADVTAAHQVDFKLTFELKKLYQHHQSLNSTLTHGSVQYPTIALEPNALKLVTLYVDDNEQHMDDFRSRYFLLDFSLDPTLVWTNNIRRTFEDDKDVNIEIRTFYKRPHSLCYTPDVISRFNTSYIVYGCDFSLDTTILIHNLNSFAVTITLQKIISSGSDDKHHLEEYSIVSGMVFENTYRHYYGKVSSKSPNVRVTLEVLTTSSELYPVLFLSDVPLAGDLSCHHASSSLSFPLNDTFFEQDYTSSSGFVYITVFLQRSPDLFKRSAMFKLSYQTLVERSVELGKEYHCRSCDVKKHVFKASLSETDNSLLFFKLKVAGQFNVAVKFDLNIDWKIFNEVDEYLSFFIYHNQLVGKEYLYIEYETVKIGTAYTFYMDLLIENPIVDQNIIVDTFNEWTEALTVISLATVENHVSVFMINISDIDSTSDILRFRFERNETVYEEDIVVKFSYSSFDPLGFDDGVTDSSTMWDIVAQKVIHFDVGSHLSEILIDINDNAVYRVLGNTTIYGAIRYKRKVHSTFNVSVLVHRKEFNVLRLYESVEYYVAGNEPQYFKFYDEEFHFMEFTYFEIETEPKIEYEERDSSLGFGGTEKIDIKCLINPSRPVYITLIPKFDVDSKIKFTIVARKKPPLNAGEETYLTEESNVFVSSLDMETSLIINLEWNTDDIDDDICHLVYEPKSWPCENRQDVDFRIIDIYATHKSEMAFYIYNIDSDTSEGVLLQLVDCEDLEITINARNIEPIVFKDPSLVSGPLEIGPHTLGRQFMVRRNFTDPLIVSIHVSSENTIPYYIRVAPCSVNSSLFTVIERSPEKIQNMLRLPEELSIFDEINPVTTPVYVNDLDRNEPIRTSTASSVYGGQCFIVNVVSEFNTTINVDLQEVEHMITLNSLDDIPNNIDIPAEDMEVVLQVTSNITSVDFSEPQWFYLNTSSRFYFKAIPFCAKSLEPLCKEEMLFFGGLKEYFLDHTDRLFSGHKLWVFSFQDIENRQLKLNKTKAVSVESSVYMQFKRDSLYRLITPAHYLTSKDVMHITLKLRHVPRDYETPNLVLLLANPTLSHSDIDVPMIKRVESKSPSYTGYMYEDLYLYVKSDVGVTFFATLQLYTSYSSFQICTLESPLHCNVENTLLDYSNSVDRPSEHCLFYMQIPYFEYSRVTYTIRKIHPIEDSAISKSLVNVKFSANDKFAFFNDDLVLKNTSFSIASTPRVLQEYGNTLRGHIEQINLHFMVYGIHMNKPEYLSITHIPTPFSQQIISRSDRTLSNVKMHIRFPSYGLVEYLFKDKFRVILIRVDIPIGFCSDISIVYVLNSGERQNFDACVRKYGTKLDTLHKFVLGINDRDSLRVYIEPKSTQVEPIDVSIQVYHTIILKPLQGPVLGQLKPQFTEYYTHTVEKTHITSYTRITVQSIRGNFNVGFMVLKSNRDIDSFEKFTVPISGKYERSEYCLEEGNAVWVILEDCNANECAFELSVSTIEMSSSVEMITRKPDIFTEKDLLIRRTVSSVFELSGNMSYVRIPIPENVVPDHMLKFCATVGGGRVVAHYSPLVVPYNDENLRSMCEKRSIRKVLGKRSCVYYNMKQGARHLYVTLDNSISRNDVVFYHILVNTSREHLSGLEGSDYGEGTATFHSNFNYKRFKFSLPQNFNPEFDLTFSVSTTCLQLYMYYIDYTQEILEISSKNEILRIKSQEFSKSHNIKAYFIKEHWYNKGTAEFNFDIRVTVGKNGLPCYVRYQYLKNPNDVIEEQLWNSTEGSHMINTMTNSQNYALPVKIIRGEHELIAINIYTDEYPVEVEFDIRQMGTDDVMETRVIDKRNGGDYKVYNVSMNSELHIVIEVDTISINKFLEAQHIDSMIRIVFEYHFVTGENIVHSEQITKPGRILYYKVDVTSLSSFIARGVNSTLFVVSHKNDQQKLKLGSKIGSVSGSFYKALQKSFEVFVFQFGPPINLTFSEQRARMPLATSNYTIDHFYCSSRLDKPFLFLEMGTDIFDFIRKADHRAEMRVKSWLMSNYYANSCLRVDHNPNEKDALRDLACALEFGNAEYINNDDPNSDAAKNVAIPAEVCENAKQSIPMFGTATKISCSIRKFSRDTVWIVPKEVKEVLLNGTFFFLVIFTAFIVALLFLTLATSLKRSYFEKTPYYLRTIA
ncbi:hypothetical protein PCE1_001077 [Barthelona sp. PCE]